MTPVDQFPRIHLKPESDLQSFDQRPHVIAVRSESSTQWEGYLVENKDGEPVNPPVFGVWPKFAWKKVSG